MLAASQWLHRAGTRRVTGALPIGMVALILGLAVIALGACGGDDDDGDE